jgi:hypothetical protein
MSNEQAVRDLSEVKFTSTPGGIKFVKAKDLAKGDSIVGIFGGLVASTLPKLKDARQKYDIKIKMQDGSLTIINSAGNLEYRVGKAMKEKGLAEGRAIQVTYLGQVKMSTGDYAGTMAHNFSVEAEAE